MTWHWIYFVAAVMVILGAVLARYSVSEAERFYARYLVIAGLLFFVLPAFWGCSSPTAPSSTYRLTFAKAPGCEPGEMPEPPSMEWDVSLRTGTDRMVFGWPNGLVVEFRSFGGHFMVCRIVSEA